MKRAHKIAAAVMVLFGMSAAEILVPDAQAFRGRGAAFVVGAAVGSAGSSSAQASAAASQQQAAAAQQQQTAVEKEKAAAAQQQAAAAQQQAAAAQQQAAAAQQQAAAAQQQAAAPAAGKPLPVGTVVSTLLPGCTPKVVGGVEYRVCGSDFYRAAFQGGTLVYVTAQP
jgi:FKBP-type peptidyl-prolyl cis-trans isomerase